MNDLNSVIIEGNLICDPIMATTSKGMDVCTFSIASKRYYLVEGKFQEEVSFFNVETSGRITQWCSEELENGRVVRVVGRIKQDRWEDKDGSPRVSVKIVAEQIDFRRRRGIT
jgi:single-strand DNA-binding protein